MPDWRDPRSIDYDAVDDWQDLRNAAEKNHYARHLERRATDAKMNSSDPTEAATILAEAKEVYWSLVNSDFEGTFPYKRLCIIYRSRAPDPHREEEVARRALDEAGVSTEKQQQWYEGRIERARELQE